MKSNDVSMRAMQNQINNMGVELKKEIDTTLTRQTNELKQMMSGFLQMNQPSTSNSLPSNTIANPRRDLKAITTRSGVSYDGPTAPTTLSSLPPKVAERETNATKDPVIPTNNGRTENVQPPVVQPSKSKDFEPEVDPVEIPKTNLKPPIPYPSRLNNHKIREKSNSSNGKVLSNFKRSTF
jgi:hypothetical protein